MKRASILGFGSGLAMAVFAVGLAGCNFAAEDAAGSDAGEPAVKLYNQKMQVGANAPAFTGKGFPEGEVELADYKGKVVLLDFWATWCPPCVVEMPNVIETYEKYHEAGLEIIGVSVDSDAAQLEAFLAANEGMTWKQVFDGKGWDSAVSNLYGVNSIPFTLLLDEEGVVRARDLHGEMLGEEVAKLLGVEEE